MKNQTAGVYVITHGATGRIYIGSSLRVEYRWVEHQRELNNGSHHNPKLLRAWRKYGGDAFQFAILEIVTDTSQLLAREQFYLDTLRPFFNCATDAYSTFAGRKHTEETKAKMIANHGGFRGGHTEEARAKMSAAAKGCQNFLGKKHSPAALAKMSAAASGRKPSPETIEKMRAARRAYWESHPVTEEERERRRLRATGVKKSEETRAKLRQSLKGNKYAQGYKQSPEHVEKVRQAKIAKGLTK